jgi:septum formation protein
LLVLASSSPQRRAILARLGVDFDVIEPDVEELAEGDPVAVARENAMRKALAVESRLARARDGAGQSGANEQESDRVVLGADTVVSLEGALYGKPPDEREARAMLASLAGRVHTVVGAVAILAGARTRCVSAETRVRFRALDERLLDWYVATGEWRGRAGGYAIQGAGAALVSEVAGDYENVVGLPVAAVLDAYPELLSL